MPKYSVELRDVRMKTTVEASNSREAQKLAKIIYEYKIGKKYTGKMRALLIG